MIYIILSIAVILSIVAPKKFVFFYCFFGCELDAYGVTSYFNQSFQYYAVIMHLLLIISLFVSFYRNRSFLKNKYIVISFVYIVAITISVLFGYLIHDYDGNIIYRVIYASTTFGPSIFIIWLCESHHLNKSTSDYSILVIAEVLLACFVIYLPSAFEAINGIKYTADGYIYSLGNRSPAQLSNFYEIFFQKGRFMATGQFHNANALGFCSGMGVVLSLLKLSDIYTIDNNPLKMNMRRKAFWIMFLLLSGFVWCSAGTRGILLTVIIVLGLIIFGSPKISQKKIVAALFIMPLGVIAVILFGDIVYSYLFGNAAATSFDSRGALIINGLKYLWDNSLFGSGGEATGLRLVGVDPHVLPLKIATLYGVLPSVISIVLIYIYPIRDLLKVNNYKVRLGSLGLLLGVWLMSITDNMALTGLFWISMAESIFYLTKGNDYENNDGKTII